MSRKSWKAAERALADEIGGERVPVSGRTRGWAPDITHPWQAVEVKTRKLIPSVIRVGMDQAEKTAAWEKRRGNEKIPVLYLHQDGTHFDRTLVVVRLRDAKQWWGIGDGNGHSEEETL